jgi:hypothetical protein
MSDNGWSSSLRFGGRLITPQYKEAVSHEKLYRADQWRALADININIECLETLSGC